MPLGDLPKSKARLVLILLTSLATIGMTAERVAATAADDQAAADAAMASFNERMAAAGGVSDGPPDLTAAEDAEAVEDDPFAGCFGDITGLEPNGRLEGETARAFSDNFTFPPDGEPLDTDPLSMAISQDDAVSAAVITVDADHADAVDELVRALGSDEAATCLEGLFNDMAADEANAGSSPNAAGFEVDVAAEADLGIGDASASLQLALTDSADGTASESNTAVYLARSDRSLVYLTISTDAEPNAVFDAPAELVAIVDSLSI